MMENVIRMLKENGFFDTTVKNIRRGMKKDMMEDILCLFLQDDQSLEDQWIEDIHKLGVETLWKALQDAVQEQEAVEALNDVDPEALFEKATGMKKKKVCRSKEELLEEMMTDIKEILDDLFDDLK